MRLDALADKIGNELFGLVCQACVLLQPLLRISQITNFDTSQFASAAFS
jgi:hypothetical protein